MTEQELRSRISRSQKEGFRALFEEYKSYVYAVVWNRIGRVGTKEDAEECVSDVFAEIFLHFDEIRPESLHGYVGMIAKRRSIDAYRRLSAREPGISLEEEGMQELAADTDIESDAASNAERRRLLEHIRSLGEPDASILLQKYYYDRSSSEIARSLKLQPAAVRMRASRALKRLRSILTADGITL